MEIVGQISKFLSPLNINISVSYHHNCINKLKNIFINEKISLQDFLVCVKLQEWVDEAAIRLMVVLVDMNKWGCGWVSYNKGL